MPAKIIGHPSLRFVGKGGDGFKYCNCEPNMSIVRADAASDAATPSQPATDRLIGH